MAEVQSIRAEHRSVVEDWQRYTEPICVVVACRLKELGTGIELVKKDN
jgi:hypothetical protein